MCVYIFEYGKGNRHWKVLRLGKNNTNRVLDSKKESLGSLYTNKQDITLKKSGLGDTFANFDK